MNKSKIKIFLLQTLLALILSLVSLVVVTFSATLNGISFEKAGVFAFIAYAAWNTVAVRSK